MTKLLLIMLAYPIHASADSALKTFSTLNNAGLLLTNIQGQPLISKRADQAFIPASATKLITAYLALKHWGADYHFQTKFYFDRSNQTLWIKASGDPFLVSEELTLIAQQLKTLGLTEIKTIALDVSLFQSKLHTPGAESSDNPYDAVPSALAANFNTLSIKKVAGKIYSAEAQTPLTAYAKSLSHRIKKRDFRINTGQSSHDAERYCAELLAAFLRQQGVRVADKIVWGKLPALPVFYTHSNSKNLAEVIRPMLKYSTNFIANQLILVLSAESTQRPANFKEVQNYMQSTLTEQFNWQHLSLKEGAGLSRANQISPQQLVQLLEAFRPWKHLLPEIETGVYAKSGTLKKVSTLAGYIVNNQQQWHAFALMINQAVPYRFRNRIARELAKEHAPKNN
ncbi:MAG: peptidase S13 [Methyloprofundus sp.]|nr:peptidase S13 [Methyloprofundus sp.]